MDWSGEWPVDEAREAWVHGAGDVFAWGLFAAMLVFVPLVVIFSGGVRRRRFYCAQSRREVEARFEERGLRGLRRAVSVLSCSVFDPLSGVQCQRRCLDSKTGGSGDRRCR